MGLLCSLAVFMCGLLPRLPSKRINHVIAREVQSSRHSEDADMNAGAYDEKLLACEQVGSQERFIIQSKDKPLVDYRHALLQFRFETDHAFNCKAFTLPHSTLMNLTTHTLPEDVIGLIGSFHHDVRCRSCQLLSFNMTFLEKCRTALTMTRHQFESVEREVNKEGGSCHPNLRSIAQEAPTLQSCMASPMESPIAVCDVGTLRGFNQLVLQKERSIKENDDKIRAQQEVIKQKRHQENENFIKRMEDVINKEQAHIEDLRDSLDMYKQNGVYLKQIFEGQ